VSSLSPEARKLLDGSRAAGGPSAAQRAAMKQAVLAAGLLPGTAAASSAVGGAKAAGLGLAAKLSLVVVSVAVGSTLVWQALSPATPGASDEVSPELMQSPGIVTFALPRAEPVEPQAPIAEPPAAVDPPRGTGAEPQVARAQPPVAEGAPRVGPTGPQPGVAETPPAATRIATPREPGTQGPSAPAATPPLEATPPPPRAPVDDATLSKEIAAVSRAMGAVDAKTWAVALAQVSSYRATFPAGALETEASVVEVLALCGLGRVDEARAAAASLPANNPAVRRLERSCIAAAK